VLALRQARKSRAPVDGKVIGWNKGGFHVAVGELYAFCPRSEMETGGPAEPAGYLDRTFAFQVLRIEDGGRRIVVSRAAELRAERSRAAARVKQALVPGAVVTGKVSSIVDFGAFVDLGEGVEGLVHVSEIAIHRVESPELELSIGQQVKVRITEKEDERRRISLSIKQASPDWKEREAQMEEQKKGRRRPQKEFEREFGPTEEERPPMPVDASLEAILQELKERGIGR
jgi:ribosomal protein S1